MRVEPGSLAHWSGEQLIQHLYGVGPEDGHLEDCLECREKLSLMQAHRQSTEAYAFTGEAADRDFLMAQRRQIYAKLARPEPWFAGGFVKRWASAAAAVLVLSGGALLYEEKHRPSLSADHVSDAELARDVSQMSQDPEAESTAPLQALFN
jgi:hypothetical protein